MKTGIDLGTTNSAVSVTTDGGIRVIKNREQMETTPSAVRVEKNGRVLVGRKAYDSRILHPRNIALEFKRAMGQRDRIDFEGVDKAYSAEELSAEVLKALLDDVERATGERPRSAVVTVPAAFGQLQCEATARAAELAGLEQAPLLQEPIAAAVAYGCDPQSSGNRWLVYDLGGGTFDVALISVRDGRLNVIEHRGDNLCGGKDIDRAIVDTCILPRLSQRFRLPSLDADEGRRLQQVLYQAAEEAKIELSSTRETTACIFDAGDDLDGEPIDAEISISRDDIEAAAEPIVARSIALCQTVLETAGADPGEVASILLVGGPTQMPFLRDRLSAELSIRLETKLDPMTVVAQGAAFYAESILDEPSTEPADADEGAVEVALAFEPVWSDPDCPVFGRLVEDAANDTASVAAEFRIEAASGHWSSGWIPLVNGGFETEVRLLPNQTNRFQLALRDAQGHSLPVNPAVFSIRHGLSVANPPLPHSIGAEVWVADEDRHIIDVLFPRSTPLPAERTAYYKARRTLRPSEPGSRLTIKLWEGEYEDPESNTWLGHLHIHSEDIRRPIPEGTEIEVHVMLDASRHMTVEAYVPLIDQRFEERVFVAQDNEESFVERAKGLAADIEELTQLATELKTMLEKVEDRVSLKRVSELVRNLEDLDLAREETVRNPDRAKQILSAIKRIRGELLEIDHRCRVANRGPLVSRQLNLVYANTIRTAREYGEQPERERVEALFREGESFIAVEDWDEVEKITDAMDDIWWNIVSGQGWYWRDRFAFYQGRNFLYTDEQAAQAAFAEGEELEQRGDLMGLRTIVYRLNNLLVRRMGANNVRVKASSAGVQR